MNEFSIDFAEFEGLSEVGGSPMYNISVELKKIRGQLSKSFRSSGGRIGVDVFTEKDREKERAERDAWVEKQMLQAAAAQSSD